MAGHILVDDVHTIAKACGVPTRLIVERLLSSVENVSEVRSDSVSDELDIIDR